MVKVSLGYDAVECKIVGGPTPVALSPKDFEPIAASPFGPKFMAFRHIASAPTPANGASRSLVTLVPSLGGNLLAATLSILFLHGTFHLQVGFWHRKEREGQPALPFATGFSSSTTH